MIQDLGEKIPRLYSARQIPQQIPTVESLRISSVVHGYPGIFVQTNMMRGILRWPQNFFSAPGPPPLLTNTPTSSSSDYLVIVDYPTSDPTSTSVKLDKLKKNPTPNPTSNPAPNPASNPASTSAKPDDNQTGLNDESECRPSSKSTRSNETAWGLHRADLNGDNTSVSGLRIYSMHQQILSVIFTTSADDPECPGGGGPGISISIVPDHMAPVEFPLISLQHLRQAIDEISRMPRTNSRTVTFACCPQNTTTTPHLAVDFKIHSSRQHVTISMTQTVLRRTEGSMIPVTTYVATATVRLNTMETAISVAANKSGDQLACVAIAGSIKAAVGVGTAGKCHVGYLQRVGLALGNAAGKAMDFCV
ncbi:hypothetical protein B0T17DRAFT_167978 [Bombardia bombarda]|uniref:Uncharacterized protein n=1 Tax=Bombardia bombarda TaxID=252184 RepID=A0AA39X8S1_9PEZI|nr:hypothetical protein B0T17DRAFT_167978 [Bombardia bombarda]